MSDYHVLIRSKVSDTVEQFRVAFHIPIPDINNQVNYSYRSALAAQVDASNPTKVPWLEAGNPTEYQAIIDGEVHEVPATVRAVISETKAQKQARMDAKYNELKAQLLSDFQEQYSYYGYDGTVS